MVNLGTLTHLCGQSLFFVQELASFSSTNYTSLIMPSFDFLIVGSGIAGLYAALLAREHGSVAILTKGKIDDCNSRFAQGGVAAAVGPTDSPELHMQDTLAAGAGLCDPEAVRVLTREGPERMADLIRLGVPFDTLHGEIALAREGAHSLPRVLHAGGDETGKHIELTLAGLAAQSRVIVLEHTLATRILLNRGVACGVEVVDADGKVEEVEARSVILATGGAGNLYLYTTNPPVATGDGVAIAFQAGAEIEDMEFFQFHPTALRLPGVQAFLISEAVRGEGGVLRNTVGKRFMERYHPMAELAPRDVVSRALVQEMQATEQDHVLLDVTHLAASRVAARFPSIYRFCLDNGLDITTTPIPVAPAAHYMMGGVKTNTWGETNIPNLYACGEVACCGVHGANRLASNSLLETLVFGKRVVQRILDGKNGPRAHSKSLPEIRAALPLRPVGHTDDTPPTLHDLQQLMWTSVGIVRDGENLRQAAEQLARWQSLSSSKNMPSLELASLVLVGRLVAEAALIREESRGAHYRSDYPETSTEWERHIVFARSE